MKESVEVWSPGIYQGAVLGGAKHEAKLTSAAQVVLPFSLTTERTRVWRHHAT